MKTNQSHTYIPNPCHNVASLDTDKEMREGGVKEENDTHTLEFLSNLQQGFAKFSQN